MKVSVWTSYLYGLTPEEIVEALPGRGWPQAELSTEHSEMLVSRGRCAEVGESFRRFAADRGMSFPQGHLKIDADVAAIDQTEVLDLLKCWLDLYLALGVKAAVIHPGGHELRSRGATAERVRDAQVRGFSELAAHVAGTDLVICMENMAGPNDLEEFTAIINACGSRHLAICLDTGHLHVAGQRQGEFIRRAGSRLKALHVADNDGSGDQHLMPFGGTIDWDDVVTALREVRYDGLFNFEIPGETACPLAVRMAKLDYLRVVAAIMLGDGRA